MEQPVSLRQYLQESLVLCPYLLVLSCGNDVQEFYLPRCAVNLAALKESALALPQIKALFDKPHMMLRPVTSLCCRQARLNLAWSQVKDALPGCVHISQDPQNKSLVYLYFKDAKTKAESMLLFRHQHQKYGKVFLSFSGEFLHCSQLITGKLETDGAAKCLPPTAFIEAPCCVLYDLCLTAEVTAWGCMLSSLPLWVCCREVTCTKNWIIVAFVGVLQNINWTATEFGIPKPL